jgi:1-acyl-sn-glycerol-3-phosphate acyltransferase
VLRAQANRCLVVVALLLLLPSIVVVERVRRGAGRRLVRWGVSVVATLCGVHVLVRGSHPADTPGRTILVPNHSSPMDIPALLLAAPAVRFVAAQDLFRIPVLAAAMRALDTVPIDRRDPDRARRQLDGLVAGDHGYGGDLVIFAEGGIAPVGTRLPFKSGAFSLAIRTGSPMVPVALGGTDRVLAPRGRLAVRPGVVTVEFLGAVETVGLTDDDRHLLRDHVEEVVQRALAVAGPSGHSTWMPG